MTTLVGTNPNITTESSAQTAPSTPSRDVVIDLVRAALLVVVVVLHALMAGITVDAEGVHIVNALEGTAGFAVASWVVQIMPLFFVVGGFAGITAWRRARARGTSPAAFAAGRLHRLGVPALVVFGTIGAGLGIAAIVGAPAQLLADLGMRLAQPMWFLAVYLGASALVPTMVRLHERAPRTTLVALGVLALGVDVVRIATGQQIVGAANLAFVWLAMQQPGFLVADGHLARRTGLELWLIAALSLTAIAALVLQGSFSPDLFENLNPPTVLLVLLGVAQAALLTLARPLLEPFARRPRVARAVSVVGSHSMTVYLWHMPALVIVAVALLASGLAWPEPLSIDWWATRMLWVASIAALVVPIAALMGRFERIPAPRSMAGSLVTTLGVGAAIVGVLAVLIMGFTPVSAAIGVAGIAGGLAAVTERGSRVPTRMPR